MGPDTADFIIVGAGLTGCVIAHRLASKGHEVLLLEAGQDAEGNPNITTPLSGFALLGTDLDWGYKTTPQANTYNRVHTINAGKALGGGTTINYGGWLRGDEGDFDAWADLVQDKRWSYEGMLPWFRKSESYFNHSASKRQHGFEGPIHVTSISGSDPDRIYPLRNPVRDAWAELGVEYNSDQDNGSTSGIAEVHENSKNGQRQPAHLAYSVKGLSNLQVLTGSLVSRVLWTERKATGIELSDGRSFITRKEVILCAGAIRTPQILLLSGIGPSEILSKHGIQLIHELPGVGKNLHDHFALFMAFRLKQPERGLALGKLQNPAFFKGLPYDWVINELEKSPSVEQQIRSEATSDQFTKSLLTHPRPLVENFTIYASAGTPGIPEDGSHVATSSMLLTPTSRGSISISSPSVYDPPEIDPCYLSTSVDRASLVHASRRTLQAMLATNAMQDYVEAETPPSGHPGLEDLCPLTPESTDEEILDRIRRTGVQHCHSGGTVAMGSVVDTEGKVTGVRGLRVADASILPVPIGGHPQATLYAVAEQIADMILGAV